MNCKGFEKYQLGEWTQAQFDTHSVNCASCKSALKVDTDLLKLAQSLKEPVEAPGLWAKIEQDLTPRGEAKIARGWFRHPILRAAAVLVLAVSLFYSVRWLTQPAASGILADSALKRVEAREQAYEEAIEELESVAGSQLTELDIELSLLYRDRLETIDEQIDDVRSAIAMNPGNAHLRRYLFAALKDKKETLREIINLTPNKNDIYGG